MDTRPDAAPTPDGMELLDMCHRQTVFALGKLSALISRLDERGADADARALAREVVEHFSTTARNHHLEEERHVFPPLLASGDRTIADAVERLRQDHGWLEEDWLELSPHLVAVANGQGWYDLELLRSCCDVFTALSHEHMALEESLIYPQSRATLDSAARVDMGRQIMRERLGAGG